jgi:hypothetical protein
MEATAIPTLDEQRNDAMSELEDARTHLMHAMRILDCPGLAREHADLGHVVLKFDEMRGRLTDGVQISE